VTSLKENVEPLALMLRSNPLQLSLRLKAGNTAASLDYLQKTWKEFAPQYPFDYFFLDEEMNQFYQSDIRLLKVLGIFSGLAICIACMGLLGLSMYAAKQRVKEIGIRKVLGAGILNITSLMTKDFLKLVLVAALISFPLAWWATNAWLEDFAYRIHLNAWVFIMAGCSVLFIALLTVSVLAVKAALANPVKSLRRE
jgi:putative ABC transport system permease protein